MSTIRKKIGEALFKNGVSEMVNSMVPFIQHQGSILDLGAGTGLFTKELQKNGYKVKPIDIQNRSYYKNIASEIYNGKKLRFKNNYFGACLLIAVLHHTQDPEVVLREAARVSKRLVVYEDAVTNIFQRWYTYVIDSILNKEFLGHPHTNKTDEQWQKLFKDIGLKIVKVSYKKSWVFLHNPMYFLVKKST